MKFGGTAVSTADRIKNLVEIVRKNSEHQIVLVVSAIRGVTDDLINVCNEIKRGKSKESLDTFVNNISNLHIELINDTIKDQAIRDDTLNIVKSLLSDMSIMLNSMNVIGEVTPRSMDYIVSFGERLIAPIITASLRDNQLDAKAFTGREAGILTDSNFGEAKPLMDTTRLRVSKTLMPLLGKIIPVVTGFIAADQYGYITTLGRGGSDYTATIIADAIDADEVWLMTDVDGLMTADPKIVPNAKVIRSVSYAEAMEMALFGAKYIHPRALEPLQERDIPIRIRNVFKPEDLGTLIVREPSSDSKQIVKAVSMIKDVALIDVRGSSMAGTPGTAGKIFNVLGENRVNIIMISQGPSESSISMVVRKNDLDKAVRALELNLLGRVIKSINVTDDVAVIAAVGSGMRGIKGVASRIFSAVASRGINVMMIAQGSSELDLAFVIDAKDGKEAVNAIHEEFKLGS